MNPLTTRVMAEIGINLDEQWSKGVREYLGRIAVRYLIIVCSDAEQRCPTIWPGMRDRLSWPFDDPAAAAGTEAEKLAEFRRVRDEIGRRIKAWLDELKQREQDAPSTDA
jgi:arsenate reductase